LLLDFVNDLLEPNFLVFYAYDSKTKSFAIFDYRHRHKKKIDFALDVHFKNDFSYLEEYLFENKIEVFTKEDLKNKEKFPLINYFDSSLFVTSIEIDNEPIGALFLYSNANKAYLNILKVMLHYVGTSLRNIKLYKDIKMMSVDTIKTLSQAIDAKSHYTRQHTERVTLYTKEILKRLDYSKYNFINLDDREKFNHDVEYASILHDIGKIGISEKILDKEDKLTDEEWEIMCTHPLIGAQIIAPVNFFRDLSPFILHHHERYDGAGYLYKLKGEDIPLGARILAVADAYDAMTSDRSYRKALSKEVAMSEIIKHAGKQFDPYISEIFLEYLNEEENEQKKYATYLST
jgi:HD-GYP domain-containing protein (c-di-GMP phosphodiesterase class II)